jgi:hypothetical protein
MLFERVSKAQGDVRRIACVCLPSRFSRVRRPAMFTSTSNLSVTAIAGGR